MCNFEVGTRLSAKQIDQCVSIAKRGNRKVTIECEIRESNYHFREADGVSLCREVSPLRG